MLSIDGSEGKGAIAAAVAKEFGVHVRVGAANAGHTVYTDTKLPGNAGPPEKHVLQQIPCAAYTNPDAILLIGPGAQISPHILLEEVRVNAEWRSALGYDHLLLVIDPRAQLISDEHIEREQITNLADRIGSTSAKAREGIGVAQAARVMRESSCEQMGTAHDLRRKLKEFAKVEVADVPFRIGVMGDKLGVLLEGTQGTGLSLATGDFPFCTSRNTTAAGLAADCGVGPMDVDRVVVVARTFPIRVAGNSGPFAEGSEETTWAELGIPPEITTVTRLERRVATFSIEQVMEAVRLNSASEIALTFCDYVCPSIAGETTETLKRFDKPIEELLRKPDFPALWAMVKGIEEATGCEVRYLGTGPHSVIDRYGLPIENPTEPQHHDHIHLSREETHTMEQIEITGPHHVYSAKTRFDLTQVNQDSTPTFPAEIDLGFGMSTTATVRVRGISIVASQRLEFSQQLHKLLDGATVLVEEISTPEDDVLNGVECDVWFKAPDAPKYLSLANSLVSCGVAEPK